MTEQLIGEYKGFKLYFLHISYSCPELKLRGYSTELALKRAIDKKLKNKVKLC